MSLGLYLRGMAPQARGGVVLEVPAEMAFVHTPRGPRAPVRLYADDAAGATLEARQAAAEIEALAAEYDDDEAVRAAHALRVAVSSVECSEARVRFADLARQEIEAEVALPMAKLRAWIRATCPSR